MILSGGWLWVLIGRYRWWRRSTPRPEANCCTRRRRPNTRRRSAAWSSWRKNSNAPSTSRSKKLWLLLTTSSGLAAPSCWDREGTNVEYRSELSARYYLKVSLVKLQSDSSVLIQLQPPAWFYIGLFILRAACGRSEVPSCWTRLSRPTAARWCWAKCWAAHEEVKSPSAWCHLLCTESLTDPSIDRKNPSRFRTIIPSCSRTRSPSDEMKVFLLPSDIVSAFPSRLKQTMT